MLVPLPNPCDRILTADDLPAFRQCDRQVIVARHHLHRARALAPAALGQLLNVHPASALVLQAIGTSDRVPERMVRPTSLHPWFQAVQAGRLQVCLQQLLDYHPDLRDAVHGMFDELEVRVAGFAAQQRQAELLLLPPTASSRPQPSSGVAASHGGVPATAPATRLFWQIHGTGQLEIQGARYPLSPGQLLSCPAHQAALVQAGSEASVILVTQHSPRSARGERPNRSWWPRWATRLHAALE